MATRTTGTAGARVDLRAFKAGDLCELQAPIMVENMGWTYGTGANQVQVIYQDTITLADAGTDTIDLYASGTYLDVFNVDLTMTAIKFLYVKNNSADATLQLFGGAANDLPIVADTSDIVEVPPGGIFVWANPTAAGTVITTNKNLKITHDGTGSDTMDVDIIAMGLD